MSNSVETDFSWPVDDSGYELVDGGRGRDAAKIRARAARWRTARPLDFYPTLFHRFAYLDKTPEACLAFANAVGLLGLAATRRDAGEPPRAERLADWYAAIDSMRELVYRCDREGSNFIDDASGLPVADVDVAIRRRPPDGRPALSLTPRTLLAAMRVQLAQRLVSPANFHACDCCGRWFERSVAGKRADARFCSDACRIAFHRGLCGPRKVVDIFSGSGSLQFPLTTIGALSRRGAVADLVVTDPPYYTMFGRKPRRGGKR